MEEISNLLGLVGAAHPSRTSNLNDFVKVSSLELVKKQLEESLIEEITTLRREFGVERMERKENEKRLTKCIEKLMEEAVKLNAKAASLEERINEIENGRVSPSGSTSNAQNSALENLPPVPPAKGPRLKAKVTRRKKTKTAKCKPKVAKKKDPSDPAVIFSSLALELIPSANTANVEDRDVQKRKSSRKGGPPKRYCDGDVISPLLTVQPATAQENITTQDIQMTTVESGAIPQGGDPESIGIIGTGENTATTTTTATPFAVPTVTEAGTQNENEGSETGQELHKKASTAGRFLPFLCVCGLEFDSESSLSEHVGIDIIEVDVPDSNPTQLLSTTVDSSSPQGQEIRQEIAINNSIKPSFSNETQPPQGTQHGRDPIRPLVCLCGSRYQTVPKLVYHIKYFSKKAQISRRRMGGYRTRKFRKVKGRVPSTVIQPNEHNNGKGMSESLSRASSSTEHHHSSNHGVGRQESDPSGKTRFVCKCGLSYSAKQNLDRHIRWMATARPSLES